MRQDAEFRVHRPHGGRPVRILVLEDDQSFSELLRTHLRRMPWVESRLEVATTLADALSKLAAESFALVLTDLHLPDASGLDAVDALCRRGEQPVIVLTVSEDPALRAGALECGAYDFLSKEGLTASTLERLIRLASIQAHSLEALRESEARFHSLLALSSDFYWETDARHRVTKVEHAMANHPAISRAQLGKTRWETPSTYPDAQGWAAHRATLEAHRPFHDFQFARVDADGVERHRLVSGEPVFDPRGAFLGYRGVGKDITEGKRTEEALRRFRLAMDTSAEMILLIDRASMRHVDVNATACRLLGYSREELLAIGPQDILPHSREALEKVYDGMIASPSTASGMRSYYRCKDGSQLPFESTRRVLRSGAGWIIAATSRDIRERIAAEKAMRESEERFRSLTALSSDWYWEQDEQFRLTFMSTIEKTGLAANAYLGRKRWEQPALNLSEADWQRHRAQLERHEPFRDFEMERPGPDGESVWLSLSGEPFFDADGAFRGYRGVGRDITQRKRSERDLTRLGRMYAALGAANEAILRATSPQEVFDRACEIAVEAGGFLLCTVLAVDPATGVLSRAAVSGLAAPRLRDVVPQIGESQPGGGGLLGHAYRTGQPSISNDYQSDPRSQGPREQMRDYRPGSAAAFPLRVEGRVAAILGVLHAERNAFSPELIGLLQRLAEDIAFALENFSERRRAEQRQAAHLRYQERIARFGQSALGKREPKDLTDEAVQTVLEALAAEAVAYVEAGASDAELVLRACVGVADAHAGVVACSPGHPISKLLRSGARCFADGAELELPWARELRSAALIPIRGEQGTRGALCVFSKSGEFAAEALNFIEAAASLLSTALQRIDSEGRLAFLAQFDPLTGLPNRALLSDRFSQMIVQARRRGAPLGVLFIDLDEFKMVNDTLGHAGGDALLKEVALRLQATVRAGDTVARISGDEFAVVLGDLARAEDAAIVAQKIIDRLGQAVEIHDKEVSVTASVGIASFPGDGGDAETLLGAADAAMYRAKQSGRNAFHFFTAEINQRSRARAHMGVELRRAFERHEFTLAYQPKYDLAERRVRGAEALLRWRHPERGVVAPAEFVPVLEETGLVVAVGEWVLRRACADINAWHGAGLAPGPIAVNLSARQFRLPDLDSRIKAIVAANGVDPALIELEITESQLMQDPDHAIRVMRALRDAGMRLAIDDFGTGYSSLSYLTRFPVSSLKIDRSFVADVNDDANDAAIVRTIIEMAHTLGFSVVAEGIETEAQAAYLRKHGCEQAQGYLFARPMAAAELAQLFARRA